MSNHRGPVVSLLHSQVRTASSLLHQDSSIAAMTASTSTIARKDAAYSASNYARNASYQATPSGCGDSPRRPLTVSPGDKPGRRHAIALFIAEVAAWKLGTWVIPIGIMASVEAARAHETPQAPLLKPAAQGGAGVGAQRLPVNPHGPV